LASRAWHDEQAAVRHQVGDGIGVAEDKGAAAHVLGGRADVEGHVQAEAAVLHLGAHTQKHEQCSLLLPVMPHPLTHTLTCKQVPTPATDQADTTSNPLDSASCMLGLKPEHGKTHFRTGN
jgi:hypothetical protein